MTSSARTRPAKPALSRDAVVTAALAVATEAGSAAVTMRRVAQVLDTAAASLYVYVADRQELMGAAHDRAVAGVELPDRTAGDWRARLELLVHRTVAALAGHGDIAAVGFTALPGPHGARIVEELARLLRIGGVDDEGCAWAVDLLGTHIAAAALEAASGDDGARSAAWVAALPAAEYPTLHALAPALGSGDAGARARWKLRVLVDGVLAAR